MGCRVGWDGSSGNNAKGDLRVAFFLAAEVFLPNQR